MTHHGRLAEFDAELARSHLQGQWVMESRLLPLTAGPPPAGKPWLWTWSSVHGKLVTARDAFADTLRARRSITFVNPTLSQRGTTHNLVAGIQLVTASEVAWSHRHSMAALRFVIEGGPGLFTAVDGVELPMEPYDLVLTPTWSWHDHHNETARDGIWLDVLDVPFVLNLHQQRFEQLPNESRTPRHVDRSPLHYAWSRVAEMLRTATDSFTKSVRLEYVSPAGGSCLTTMCCFVDCIAPGTSIPVQRTPASAIAFVVKGTGEATIDGETIAWSQHDTFSIPAWSTSQMRNASPDDHAVLFLVSDEALLRAVGLLHPELDRVTETIDVLPDDFALTAVAGP